MTPATLETLSIVAYNGPIARSMIDYLRGVNSGYILRNLLVRGLIERYPIRNDLIFFIMSVLIFETFGLAKQEDLPEYQKYKDICLDFQTKGAESSISKLYPAKFLSKENAMRNNFKSLLLVF